MVNIRKIDLVNRLAGVTRLNRRKVKLVIECLLREISIEMCLGNRVAFSGFGSFQIRKKTGMPPVNRKGIPMCTIKFKTSKILESEITEAQQFPDLPIENIPQKEEVDDIQGVLDGGR